MSELSSETQPQIQVNGETLNPVTIEEPISLSAAMEETIPADKETQGKMQSLFQQVRNQIKSQMGPKAPKSSILELVQMVKDKEMEMALMNSEPDGKNSDSEEKNVPEMVTKEDRSEVDLKKEEYFAVFERELEASKKALRDEFKEQLSQLREEMRAYTDQALKDMECKMRSRHPREPLESKGPDKKQKSSAAPTLASRKTRVLTRTMTTIVPKTCAPVIICPRAKSETLSSSKDASSQLLLKDPDFSVFTFSGNRHYQRRQPLPPAYPPIYHRQKLVQTKAQTGN